MKSPSLFQLQRAQKADRIDLGIAIAHALSPPGRRWEQTEIAALCDCSKQAVQLIEQNALRHCRARLIKFLAGEDLPSLQRAAESPRARDPINTSLQRGVEPSRAPENGFNRLPL